MQERIGRELVEFVVEKEGGRAWTLRQSRRRHWEDPGRRGKRVVREIVENCNGKIELTKKTSAGIRLDPKD